MRSWAVPMWYLAVMRGGGDGGGGGGGGAGGGGVTVTGNIVSLLLEYR